MSSIVSVYFCNPCGPSYYGSVFFLTLTGTIDLIILLELVQEFPNIAIITDCSGHFDETHKSNCTSGMRVGAKAVECLSLLKEARAVHFYRDYSEVQLLCNYTLFVLYALVGEFELPAFSSFE